METTGPNVYAEFYQAATYVLSGACALVLAAIGVIYNSMAKRVSAVEDQMFKLLTETLPKEYAKKDEIEKSLDAIHSMMRDWRAEQKEQFQSIAKALSEKQDKAH